MLERVPLLDKHLDDYAERRRARHASSASASWPSRSQGARVLHINATAYGGGVAELLATHVAAARATSASRPSGRSSTAATSSSASPRRCTTRCRAPTSSGPRTMERIYLERVLDNALAARRRVGLHRHPRPAARRDARVRARPRRRPTPSTKWIWRCHIDLTDANPTVWDFFRPFVEQYDASVWTMPQFVPASLHDGPRRARAAVHRPAVGEEPRPRRPVRRRRSASSTASRPTTRSSCR